MFPLIHRCIFFLVVLGSMGMKGQSHTITPTQKDQDCTKGAAGVDIKGVGMYDTLSILWSNGRQDVASISELDAGDYTAQIIIKHKLDTTVTFKIAKIECIVYISNHFTPNGDDYNDTWQIANTQYFPDFHLFVYDKWGQQVHKQSGTYTKWNGCIGGSGIPVADGTYYYIFYYKGTSGDYIKGDVTILR